MIAFFDTNILIDLLKGIFPKRLYNQYREKYIVRMCPVVYQELIRGIRSDKLRKKVEVVAAGIIFLSPPTNRMWIQSGELAGKVVGGYDERSMEKIQNDLLIALTARQNGAVLITRDRHFKMIQRYVPFSLILIS